MESPSIPGKATPWRSSNLSQRTHERMKQTSARMARSLGWELERVERVRAPKVPTGTTSHCFAITPPLLGQNFLINIALMPNAPIEEVAATVKELIAAGNMKQRARFRRCRLLIARSPLLYSKI